MASDLVPLTRYACVRDARAAKTFLASYGIRAVVGDGNDPQLPTSANDWHGIELSIAADQVERAKELFNSPEGDEYAGGWICRQCGESVSFKFGVCWRCGTYRNGERDPTFRPIDPDANDEFNGSEDIEPQLVESAPDIDQLLTREPAAGEPAWHCRNCSRRVADDELLCWNCGATREGQINPYSSPLLTAAPQPTSVRKPKPDYETGQKLTAEAESALLSAVVGCIWPPSLVKAIFALFELRSSLYQLPSSATWRYAFGWIIAWVGILEWSFIAFAIYMSRNNHGR